MEKLRLLSSWEVETSGAGISLVLAVRRSSLWISHSEHDPQAPNVVPNSSALRQIPPTLDCLSSIPESAHSLQVPFIRADHPVSQPSRSLKGQGSHPEYPLVQLLEQDLTLQRRRVREGAKTITLPPLISTPPTPPTHTHFLILLTAWLSVCVVLGQGNKNLWVHLSGGKRNWN